MAIQNKSVRTALTFFTDTLFYIVGSIFYAGGITTFAVPNHVAQSGAAGLAIAINYLFPAVSVGLANFLVNVPLFILAWFFIGKRFVGRTLYVVGILSVTLDLTERFIPKYTGDAFLASVFCGALAGVGMAIIMLRGATSGGTDILGKLLQKFFPQFSIGTGIAVSNAVVVAIGAVLFRSVESAMYAVVVIVISGKVLDYIVYGVGKGKLLLIITEKPDEMSREIIARVGRGVSILPAVGAYTGEQKSMLVVAIHRGDAQKIYDVLKTVDEHAFSIITEAGEVLGQGFKRRSEDV